MIPVSSDCGGYNLVGFIIMVSPLITWRGPPRLGVVSWITLGNCPHLSLHLAELKDFLTLRCNYIPISAEIFGEGKLETQNNLDRDQARHISGVINSELCSRT